MNKLYEKLILGVLLFIVLFNLVSNNLLEGNTIRDKTKQIKNINKNKNNNNNQMKKITNTELNKNKNKIINKTNKKINIKNHSKNYNRDNQQDKEITNRDNQQDKEITNLNNKIKKLNSLLINSQRLTNEKIPLYINHVNSQSDLKLDKIQEQISNNILKNQELKLFSEKKGRELQGNIDLLSSDLANNNVKYTNQMTEINHNLDLINKKINTYEKNNSNIEEMLKNVNLQLQTSFVNK